MKKRIKVKLGSRSYKIYVENNIINQCGELISSISQSEKILVLSTEPIFKIYGKSFVRQLEKSNLRTAVFLIADGETQKNENSLFRILKKMAELGLQRNSCLIALGGGVVGDLCGFAASIYMRGINFIQFPTTFLAQVDASIGGKTAIDFYGIKNLVGSFYQPKLVIVDPTVLKTLDQRQIKTGLAEVIKYGVIKDEKMFEIIEEKIDSILDKETNVLFHLIYRSCQIKAQIVSEDEKESGRRAWLNYGHTLGHALESYYQYQLLTHGEAIAYGMWFASLLSQKMGLCSQMVVDRQIDLLKRAGLLKKILRFNNQKIYEKMLLDKKARDGQIQFVLTRKIGLVTIQKNISKSLIFSTLNQLQDSVSGLL